MIIGIGTDILEIVRIKKACEKESFVKKAFTKEESLQAKGNAAFLAGCFCVKEAVSKTFKTGVSGFELTDIEVLRDEHGAPYVNLYGGALKKYNELQATNLQVSISNSDTYACAMAILEGDKI